MLKKLQKVGNSKALILSKDMLAHLGIDDTDVDVQFQEQRIVIKKPLTVHEATAKSLTKYEKTYKRLAE